MKRGEKKLYFKIIYILIARADVSFDSNVCAQQTANTKIYTYVNLSVVADGKNQQHKLSSSLAELFFIKTLQIIHAY